MKAYLSLGSNLGNKEVNLNKAIRKIDDLAGQVLRSAQFFHSKPWGFNSKNNFINTVILIETPHQPQELLSILQNIEKHIGRKHKTNKLLYEDRIIDIDILLYDDIQLDTPELTIPHPRMKERDFIMIPLKEIFEREDTFL